MSSRTSRLASTLVAAPIPHHHFDDIGEFFRIYIRRHDLLALSRSRPDWDITPSGTRLPPDILLDLETQLRKICRRLNLSPSVITRMSENLHLFAEAGASRLLKILIENPQLLLR